MRYPGLAGFLGKYINALEQSMEGVYHSLDRFNNQSRMLLMLFVWGQQLCWRKRVYDIPQQTGIWCYSNKRINKVTSVETRGL